MRQSLHLIILLCAVWIVVACGSDKGERLQQLEMLEQMNRADSVMRNDSLAEDLVTYFDKHGTPNERMRAHYMLGRTYFDLGELPRALEIYLQAADCADTTASDCDYKTLSRVYANMGSVYQRQLQSRSWLNVLSRAKSYAMIANDTLMAIECYTRQANAYKFMNKPDSVVYIKERAADLFLKINRYDRYAQTMGGIIGPLLTLGDFEKAKRAIDLYESSSGFFDENGTIKKGRIIYYYIKGDYYLAVNKIDSAEYMYRRELSEGTTLNHQIAGNKGLQKVYERKGISDSIAKYANLGYILNDSAYSLSEMQNIQELTASYNYHHNRLLAEQNSRKADRAFMIIIIIVLVVIIVSMLLLYRYLIYRKRQQIKLIKYQQDLEALERAQTELQELRSEENILSASTISKLTSEIDHLRKNLKESHQGERHGNSIIDKRLTESKIVKHLTDLLKENPPKEASVQDFKDLKNLINTEIPDFYGTLNTTECTLRPIEYEVCLLIRVRFSPAEICKLTGRSDSYIANLRKGILLKEFGIKGLPKELDSRILSIV